MSIINYKASRDIAAPARIVYGLISDYKQGHPSILPPEYFDGLDVLEGGQGAGTRIRFAMKAFGSRVVSHSRVTEPEPGRILVETDENTGTKTTFIVESLSDGRTRVTFDTDYHTRGLRAVFERLLVPGFLRKVYDAELKLLEQRALEAGRT